MQHSFRILALIPALLLSSTVLGGAPEELKAMTGAHTRVVWIQDAGDKPCAFSEWPTVKLIGLDSEDGKGEREIISTIGSISKPVIMADGKRVAFGNKVENTCYVVNWDGSGLRAVVKDAEFQDVWTDPRDGTDWIYAKVKEKRGEAEIPVIRRFRMDNPTASELIWDKMPVSMFMVSGDGKVASGGGDGGNSPQGMLTLPNGNFYQMAGGCWPSMSRDNSHRMWVFTGNHRSIHFCVPANRTGKAITFGSLFHGAPGVLTSDEMYHPRWTNNIRFAAMTGPYGRTAWRYSEETKLSVEAARGVEVYLGRFSEDFTHIEAWVKVSNNQRGDYWPDAWIEPNQKQPVVADAEEPVSPQEATTQVDTRGLVYAWENASAGNQVIEPKTGAIRQCTGQLHGMARYGRGSVMDLAGGSFVPDNADVPLLAACRQSNQLGIEATITPTGEDVPEGQTVMAFGSGSAGGNFALVQRGSWLMLRLRTDGAGTYADEMPLFQLVRNQPNHVVVSYSPGKLACYLNGRRALLRNGLRGGFGNWDTQRLIFGDSWEGGSNWVGLMEGVAIYAREIGAEEARQRFARASERNQDRKPLEPVVLEAKLIDAAPAADPKGISPYKRCVSVHLYEVQKVVQGRCDEKKICVAHWSVMDGKVVPSFGKLVKGQSYTLTLEKWDDHPEQHSERMINGDYDDQGAAMYYDVSHREIAPVARKAVADVQLSGDRLTISGSEKPLEGLGQDVQAILTEPKGRTLTITNRTLSDVTFNGTAKMAGAGSITAVTVLDGGWGYRQAPRVSFTGEGQGAAAEATMSVTEVAVARLGSGYSKEPTVTLALPDIAGGRQATAKARFDKVNGTIAGVSVVDSGSGYTKAPKVTISGGGGSGAEAEATLSVSGIVVTDGGRGYAVPPQVKLAGGDGQDALAQAAIQVTLLQCTDADGKIALANQGLLTQDGAAVVLDWAGAARSLGKRAFSNRGTWTLQNGSVLQFLSSTGQVPWFGRENMNAGTLKVHSGSRLGMAQLANTGTLELGAGAVLGQSEFATEDNTLVNAPGGVINVIGGSPQQPATFGYTGQPSTGKRTLNNGSEKDAGAAQLNIGSGQDAAVLTIMGGNVYVNNYRDSRIDLRSGATLALITNDNGSNHRFYNRDAKVSNAGRMSMAGRLLLQSNHGGAVMIDNSGVLSVDSASAVFERLPSSTGPGAFYKASENSAQVMNRADAVMQGNGILTYVNSTGTEEMQSLQVINLGTLAPGNGTSGRGLESVGRLELRHANVSFGAVAKPKQPPIPGGGMLCIDIGGPASNAAAFDTLSASGKLVFIEGAGNVLNIVPVNGQTPHGTYRIVAAGQVSGKFDRLLYNGAAEAPYTVTYGADAIDVVFP